MRVTSFAFFTGMIAAAIAAGARADGTRQLPLNADNCAIMHALGVSLPARCGAANLGTERGIVVRLNDSLAKSAQQPKPAPVPQKVAVAPQPVKKPKAKGHKFSPEAAQNDDGYFIQFALDSSDLEENYRQHLDRLAMVLKSEAMVGSCLRVVGHTDTSGSEQYNKRLSEKRAVIVASYLSTQGKIDPKRIAIAGMGETKPLPEIHGHDPLNRRVEFATKPSANGC